jgi:hypothetical protein
MNGPHPSREHAVLDLAMLALGAGGFVLLALYLTLCERI